MTRLRRILLFPLFLIGGLWAAPSKGDVISFEPLIQDEPRIKFGKGVEESVAPTTGSLSVTLKDLTLAGRGNVPLEIKHHYDSTGVAAFADEEISGASLSTIGVAWNLSGCKSFGGLFYSQYGVNDVVSLIKEGLIEEVLVFAVRQIPGVGTGIAGILETIFSIVQFDFIDNSNIHIYLPQLTPSVGKVRGLYSPHVNVANVQVTAAIEAMVSAIIGASQSTPQDAGAIWDSILNAAFEIHPANTLSVIN
jgi:hypothetical protein